MANAGICQAAAADTVDRILEDIHELLLQVDCYDTKSMEEFEKLLTRIRNEKLLTRIHSTELSARIKNGFTVFGKTFLHLNPLTCTASLLTSVKRSVDSKLYNVIVSVSNTFGRVCTTEPHGSLEEGIDAATRTRYVIVHWSYSGMSAIRHSYSEAKTIPGVYMDNEQWMMLIEVDLCTRFSSILYAEFLTTLIWKRAFDEKNKPEVVFKEFDKDGSGPIKLKELKTKKKTRRNNCAPTFPRSGQSRPVPPTRLESILCARSKAPPNVPSTLMKQPNGGY